MKIECKIKLNFAKKELNRGFIATNIAENNKFIKFQVILLWFLCRKITSLVNFVLIRKDYYEIFLKATFHPNRIFSIKNIFMRIDHIILINVSFP